MSGFKIGEILINCKWPGGISFLHEFVTVLTRKYLPLSKEYLSGIFTFI